MIFQWFNASEAKQTAAELADQYAPRAAGPAAPVKQGSGSLQDLLHRADSDTRLTDLNFFKKAQFANSFRWRLLENGIEARTADNVTRSLIVHLSRRSLPPEAQTAPAAGDAAPRGNDVDLLRRANKAFAGGAYQEALKIYQKLAAEDPANPEILNNLGASLWRVGGCAEAEQRFRQALTLDPEYVEANCNLGNLLRWMGNVEESEVWLRRALKANPTHTAARCGLGLTLTFLGRVRDAKARFDKVLKTAPRDPDALFGMGLVARAEGRFSEAETLIKQSLAQRPNMVAAWAALTTLRKMTPADGDWLRSAKDLMGSGLSRPEELDLLFAIGKYHDDLGEFDEAFRSFEAGNALLKSSAIKYDRKRRDGFIDDLIHVYSKDAIAGVGEGGSGSTKPVFILGMPRSGASLTEHILASHPSIFGVGEMGFWHTFTRTHESEVRKQPPDPATRQKLAEDYLRVLQGLGDGVRVVDATTMNSDYIGIIYSVFPNARFIYMDRDPIETCLSCYAEQFGAALNFTMDLSDLAHYYNGHRKLFHHWQSVLPPQSMLVVSHEEIVRDPETATRKMLDFLGLEWDDRCLSFQDNQRSSVTAGTWQVRQNSHIRSVARSQAYKKFLGPLKALRR